MTWSASEVFVGITCASLPALKRFVQKLFPRLLQGSSYPSATRPSGNGPDLPYTNHGSNAGRKPIPLGAVRTLSKNSDLVTVARSVSKDSDETSGDCRYEHSEAQKVRGISFEEHDVAVRGYFGCDDDDLPISYAGLKYCCEEK